MFFTRHYFMKILKKYFLFMLIDVIFLRLSGKYLNIKQAISKNLTAPLPGTNNFYTCLFNE